MTHKKDLQIIFRPFSWNEFEKHSDLVRRHFGTDADPGQIPPEPEYAKKMLQLNRRCVLYADFPNGKPVGSAFAFPTTSELIGQFDRKEITERNIGYIGAQNAARCQNWRIVSNIITAFDQQLFYVGEILWRCI